ncbi:MAG: hypothetical protein GW836_05395 [Paraglaciecola sp.]|nr:hypothetical protein [Paraglaciecola sp.]
MSLSLEHAQLMSIGDLASATAADLQQVQAEASELLRKSKALKDWIDGAVALKYEQRAQAIRLEQGKDTGKVHFMDDGIRVTSELSKRPEWDQQKLADIAKRIAEAGDDPAEFIDVAYKVSERKYTAWPESLRAAFEPARTLKTGKPTFHLETVKE